MATPTITDVNVLSTAILSAIPTGGWQSRCAAAVLTAIPVAGPSAGSLPGLVDQSGLSVSHLDLDTWGVNYDTCVAYCGAAKIPSPDFQFSTFAAVFTSYLLPWFALVAQLPYQTDTNWNDLMSLCMSIGSPTLITYSLVLTILNRNWVRRRFDGLYDRLGRGYKREHYDFTSRLKAVQYLLQEAQQVPIRAYDTHGGFTSLLVRKYNNEWWDRLKNSLQYTRRGVTFSLVAQMLLAVIAWLLTVIMAFQANLGDSSTALEIAAGTIWVWMIPILTGWIMVGTQSRYDSIGNALDVKISEDYDCYEKVCKCEDGTKPHECKGEKKCNCSNCRHPITRAQDGIYAKPFITLRYNADRSLVREELNAATQRFEDLEDQAKRLDNPEWLWSDVRGDERRHGPIYNYARLLTWWQFASSTYDILDARLERYEKEKKVDYAGLRLQEGGAIGEADIEEADEKARRREESSRPQHEDPPTGPTETGDNAHSQHSKTLHDSKEDDPDPRRHDVGSGLRDEDPYRIAFDAVNPNKALQERLNIEPKPAYLPWKEFRAQPNLAAHMVIAALVALFVQWGTSGASILIAYLTPSVGLGCHSAGFLFYAILGTVSWALFVASMLLSHAAMLHYQGPAPIKVKTSFPAKGQGTTAAKDQSSAPVQTEDQVSFAPRTEHSDPALEKASSPPNGDDSNTPAKRPSAWARMRTSSTALLLRQPTTPKTPIHPTPNTTKLTVLRASAVLTRYLAKTIAVANSIWLILSSILEAIGGYDNCWCNTNYFSTKGAGWTNLFKSAGELAAVAAPSWGGAIVLSVLVCVLAVVFFWLGSKNTRDD